MGSFPETFNDGRNATNGAECNKANYNFKRITGNQTHDLASEGKSCNFFIRPWNSYDLTENHSKPNPVIFLLEKHANLKRCSRLDFPVPRQIQDVKQCACACRIQTLR